MTSYRLDSAFPSQVVFLNTNNSKYRAIDGKGSYVFNFNTPITVPLNCVMILSITDAQFPNIMPLFNDNNNRLFFFVPDFNRLIDITIPESIYGVEDFLRYVNKQIQLQANGLFSLIGTYSNFKIRWVSNYEFDIVNSDVHKTTCLKEIGAKRNNFGDFINERPGFLMLSKQNPSYHIQMPSTVDFTGTRFIFFKLKNITVNNMNSNGILDNAVVRIDNNAQPGSMIFYRPLEVQKFLIQKKNIQTLEFILTDVDDNLINIFSGNAQVTMKMEFIYIPDQRDTDEGTISYTFRKLGKIPNANIEDSGIYNPVTNTFIRDEVP